MTHRSDYLARISHDDDARAHLVSTLTYAAAVLDGSAPAIGPGAQVEAAHKTAARLIDVAQRLCDHTRVETDGRCRYCRALLGAEAGS